MSDRLLVVGGTGMLGHRLVLEAMPMVDTWWTARSSNHPGSRLLPLDRQIPDIDITDRTSVARAVAEVSPSVVINCAGTVKQRIETGTPEMIRTNSVFPHELADECDRIGARLVHVSTDCVFSGSAGDRPHGYSVRDTPDADEVYGRSKLLGEICRSPHLTVRNAMIGPELSQHRGLMDWFRRASEPIAGYSNALFSGLTTPVLSRMLIRLAVEHRDLSGLYHLAGPAIDKYSLLVMLRDRFRPGATIVPDEAVRVDRRLDGRVLADLTFTVGPTWDEMLDELAANNHDYTRES